MHSDSPRCNDAVELECDQHNESNTFPEDLPPLTFADTVSPCGHNDWQTLRVKRGFITTLQCRHCLSTWKLPRPMRMACRTFHVNGGQCPLGASCPYIHLSRPKARQQHPPGAPEVAKADVREAAVAVLMDHGIGMLTSEVAEEILSGCDCDAPSSCEEQRDSEVVVDTPTTEQSTESETPDLSDASAPTSPLAVHVRVHMPYAVAEGMFSENFMSPPRSPSVEQRRTPSPTLSCASGSSSERCSAQLLPITRQYVPLQRRLISGEVGEYSLSAV